MKRFLSTITVVFILIIGRIYAVEADTACYNYEPPFIPVSPEIMGQGGSLVANDHGYNSLFQNPAGFAGKASLTLLSACIWVYADPVRFLTGMPGLDAINHEITQEGFGIGASSGIAYVGHGLGLGAVLIEDSYLYGTTIAGARGYANATLGFIAGLAFPVKLSGIRFQLGADVRPMIRIQTDEITSSTLNGLLNGSSDPFNGLYALHGFGLGLDAGAIIQLGDLKLGLCVRDILGTRFSYYRYSSETLINSGLFPDISEGIEVIEGIDDYIIPMDVSMGVAFNPDLGSLKYFMDPVIHADIHDIMGIFCDECIPWTFLHLGMEVKLLRFLSVRCGFNRGNITFGAGIKLLFLDINAAVFMHKWGEYVGYRPNTGMTMEMAVRF